MSQQVTWKGLFWSQLHFWQLLKRTKRNQYKEVLTGLSFISPLNVTGLLVYRNPGCESTEWSAALSTLIDSLCIRMLIIFVLMNFVTSTPSPLEYSISGSNMTIRRTEIKEYPAFGFQKAKPFHCWRGFYTWKKHLWVKAGDLSLPRWLEEDPLRKIEEKDRWRWRKWKFSVSNRWPTPDTRQSWG